MTDFVKPIIVEVVYIGDIVGDKLIIKIIKLYDKDENYMNINYN